MKVKLIALFFLSFQVLNSQTNISAGAVSGTWTKAGSPYKILGDITINKGSTLKIEPGVVVEFSDNYGLKVDGILLSEGKQGDSITYKAAPNKTWAGIHFINNKETDTIKFNYCVFENIGKGFKYGYVNYGICVRNSSNCYIYNTSFYFKYNNIVQGGFIRIFKSGAILKNINYFSKASSIETFNGSFSFDSSTSLNINNIKFNQTLSAIDYNFTFLINGLSSGSIKNIYNFENSSINLVIGNSFNIISDSFNLNSKVNFLVSNSRNCKISNSKFINSNKSITIRTLGNCTGTIFENCELINCGSYIKDQMNSTYESMRLESNGPLFLNCKFKDSKRGIYVRQQDGAGMPIFLNCEFSNTQYMTGLLDGYPVFINCNFTNNKSLYKLPHDTAKVTPYTGGVRIITEFYQCHSYFYNCLFWGNKDSAGKHASILLLQQNNKLKVTLQNCIIQGDSIDGVVAANDNIPHPREPFITGNLIYTKSTGNQPGFVDSANNNHSLVNTCSEQAYAINRGMSGNLLTQYPYNVLNSQYKINIYNIKDLAGNWRVQDDTIDIGCYESSGSKKLLKIKSNFNDTTICYGANLAYETKNLGHIENYNWQKKENNQISTVSSNPTLTLNTQKDKETQYRLMVTNNECAPLKDSSRWWTVTVNKPIKKGILKNPNKDSIKTTETMQLSTTTIGYNKLLWSTGAQTSSISFLGSELGPLGRYRFSIEATKNDGCIETDTIFIKTYESSSVNQANNIPIAIGIKIYPNPNRESLTIESNNINIQQIELYTLTGEKIDQQIIPSNQQKITIHHQLPKGIYFIKIHTDSQVIIEKVLIE